MGSEMCIRDSLTMTLEAMAASEDAINEEMAAESAE